MDYDIKLRVLKSAQLFLENKATVRGVAKMIGCSKSTVHKDLTERLPEISKETFIQVRDLLEYNKNIRHLRGGEATKQIYLNKKGH